MKQSNTLPVLTLMRRSKPKLNNDYIRESTYVVFIMRPISN